MIQRESAVERIVTEEYLSLRRSAVHKVIDVLDVLQNHEKDD